MKVKNKLTSKNRVLFVIFFIIEIVFICYELRYNLNLYVLSKPTRYIQLILSFFIIDIIFAFLILDIQNNSKNPKEIRKFGGYEINSRSKKIYIIFSVIKCIYIYLIKIISIKGFIIFEAILNIIFVVLQFVIKQNDNKEKIIKRFLVDLKNKQLKNNIVLFEDDNDVISSSFDMITMNSVSNYNQIIYIDYKNDLDYVLRKGKLSKKEFFKNVQVFIKTKRNATKEDFIEFKKYYELEGLDLKQNYNILAIDNDTISIPEEINYIDSLKKCNIEKCDDFIETLLLKEKRFSYQIKERIKFLIVNKLKYTYLLEKNWFKDDKERRRNKIENLNWICQDKYENRLKNIPEIIPIEKDLFHLYKNAFHQTSIHQSCFILLNYINCICQEVSYYIFFKNKKLNEENANVLQDDLDTCAFTLIKYLKNDDCIYNNVLKEEFIISEEFKDLLYEYISDLIDTKIVGNKITFFGAIEIVGTIRNKIQAHGSISEKDMYLLWNIMNNFATLFNKIFKIDEFMSKKEKDKIFFKYKVDDKYIDMNDFIIIDKNQNTYIAQSGSKNGKGKSYINYLIGRYTKPSKLEF